MASLLEICANIWKSQQFPFHRMKIFRGGIDLELGKIYYLNVAEAISVS